MAGVASPCTNVCQLNADRICVGRGRSLDEIAEWTGAGEERCTEILRLAAERLSAIKLPAREGTSDDAAKAR